MKKLVLFLLILSSGTLLLTESCTKSSTYYDAIVIDDDCGWLLNIEGTVFFAAGLKEENKVDGMKITIQYQVSATTHTCQDGRVLSIASITRYL